MEIVTRFITQKLKVNEAKGAVARPQDREFLGFTFTAGPELKRTIAPEALARFKRRIREVPRRAKSVSMETAEFYRKDSGSKKTGLWGVGGPESFR